jgi:hypothetical protein
MLPFEARDPSIQSARRSRVAPPQAFDAAPDLAEHEDTQPEGATVDTGVPSQNVRVRALPLPELGDDVRVEQPSAQSLTPRLLAWGRPKSSSAPTSGISASVVFSDPGTSPRSACRRISRCSASADRLCSAARRLRETTTWLGRFRTISCAIAINDSIESERRLEQPSAAPPSWPSRAPMRLTLKSSDTDSRAPPPARWPS